MKQEEINFLKKQVEMIKTESNKLEKALKKGRVKKVKEIKQEMLNHQKRISDTIYKLKK